MSDFQDRNPFPDDPAGPRGPEGGGGATGGSVHQVVFRWDGNHGRQGTGMNAVAHSCDPGRAGELGRELGPLLWVSGAAAAPAERRAHALPATATSCWSSAGPPPIAAAGPARSATS
ncbi:hypothetical protein GCM10023238_36290 [Streptomyces heliomycini]